MPFGSYLLMINLHWFWLTVDYKQNLTKQIITGDQFIDGGGYIVVVSLDGGICFERCYPEWHLGELKSQRKATTEALVRILSMPSHNCLVLWIPSCRLQDGWSGLNLPSALQNWGRDPWAFSCWPPPSDIPVAVASFTVSMGLFTLVICTWCIYIGHFFSPWNPGISFIH